MGRTGRGRAVALLLAGLTAGGACGTGSARPGGALETIADRQPAPDNVVVEWNGIARRATATAPWDPPRETRTLAMVQGAVYDALTGAADGASAEAAVTTAAHDVLLALYPPQQAALDDAYQATLADVADGPAKEAGLAAGRAAAARMLADRAGDHADEQAAYTPDPTTGTWRPTPPALANGARPRLGQRDTVRAAAALAVPARPPSGNDQPPVRP